jgi:succinate dehydrogenase/fumarate reductase flavoprotein subunit
MSQENEPRLVSRRTLLKKAAAISVGVTAVGALGACAPSASATASASKTQKWDKEVDVLVVGSGTAAMSAIAAKDAGAASVLIIEKGPAFGGTSALSGGGMWIPLNYLEKAKGIEDSKEDALKYLKTVTDGQSTDELMNAYLDNGNTMLEWLRDMYAFEFDLGSPMFNDYYEVPGFRAFGRTVYFGENGQSAGGAGGWKVIKATCDKLGIEVMLNTAGKKLVTNDVGEVIGIIATDENGKDLAIHAKKGVILGTGGFDFNKDMVAGSLRGPIMGSVAVRTNTGDGHVMGMALGAALSNMNSCWGLPFFPQNPDKLQGVEDWQTYRGKPGAVVVNKHGERIGDESSAYHIFNRAFWFWDTGTFEWRNTPSYWMCDSTFLENYPMPGANYKMGVVPDWMKKADTLEDLCKALGVDVAGFSSTITAFNENAKNGTDPVWHRGEYSFDKNTAGDLSGKRTELVNNCLAPLEKGPFYGAEYGPGTCGTNGGLRINGSAQVLDVWGQPIPRLYAVGNTSGSVMGAAYPGGGSTVGAGCVMGYVAGKHSAGLTSLA